MVTRIRHEVLDDLTGEDGATTRSYSVDGQDYQIDLNDENWTAFQEAIKKYVEVSRRTGVKRPSAAKASNPDNAKVREWLKAQGHEVPARGRIPQSLRDLYEAAH